MAGTLSRRHHFVPRFMLGGFTDTGEPGGFLHVHDLHGRRRAWRGRPESVAHVRDFYRVEGEDPGLAEAALSRIETAGAPIIRRIQETDALPDGEDFEMLLDFVATLAARVPKRREVVSRFMEDAARMILEIATGTPERYEAQVRRMRAEGGEVPEVSFEEMRAYVKNRLELEVNPTWSVGTMFEEMKIIGPVLRWRTWALLRAVQDAPNFICSDNPVAILPSRPDAFGPFGSVGWGMPGTFVVVPLHRRAALYGMLEELPPPGRAGVRRLENAMPIEMRKIATLNTAALASADKYVYSPREDFIWMKPDSTIGHASDLASVRAGE